MSGFALAVAIVGSLVCPVVALSYVRFRLGARREQLVSLFTLPGIVERYLQAKGREVPKRAEGSADRLRTAFHEVFTKEFGREYGVGYFMFSILLASFISTLVVVVLVCETLGPSLSSGRITSPLKYALLGGFFWSMSSLIRGYAKTDVTPITFYWIVLRYILATCVGVLAQDMVLNAGGGTDFAAFAIATLPFGEVVRMVSSRLTKILPGYVAASVGHPSLDKLQGVEQTTLEKLEQMGISTTAELAQVDPLTLLFQANFSPKVVIDWIDQAFLYNYVGDKVEQLRVRGIRGAIELASLREEDDALLESIAKVLDITPLELRNLIENLYQDNQVRLIWEIWGGFEK